MALIVIVLLEPSPFIQRVHLDLFIGRLGLISSHGHELGLFISSIDAALLALVDSRMSDY